MSLFLLLHKLYYIYIFSFTLLHINCCVCFGASGFYSPVMTPSTHLKNFSGQITTSAMETPTNLFLNAKTCLGPVVGSCFSEQFGCVLPQYPTININTNTHGVILRQRTFLCLWSLSLTTVTAVRVKQVSVS